MIIWLASYPRSGNTFLRVILKNAFGLETYSVYDDKTDIAKHRATAKIVGHKMLPADFDLEAARKSNQLYLIKTHGVDCIGQDKAIYLVRDGRQSSLSYMNYINSFGDQKCEITDVLHGNVNFGAWGDHVRLWDPRHRQDTLLIKFERMTAAPESVLEEIAQFIGVKKSADEIPSFDELHEINPKFFRQGKSNTWERDLTADDADVFWVNNLPQMKEMYAEESPPEWLQDSQFAARVNKLFCDNRAYHQAVISELRDQKKENEANLRSLSEKVSSLENQLQQSKERLAEIESSISRVVEVRFWKSPWTKYRKYKDLLDVFFRN